MKKSCWGMTTTLAVCVLLCIGGCKEDQKKEPLSAISDPVAVERQNTTPKPGDNDGQALFQKHCAVCHPGGGNIINPSKTLDGETLVANGITTVGDIVDNVRQPGPGMTRFSKDQLSDREAGRIAEYILQSY
ncbi:MAG: c-type cytochrome [Desulfuromonadaceae bacterium]|nr:c-type cytochrome [Desulfuromonadaceae bacterium]